MKALVRHGKSHMQCDTVPDPKIIGPTDMLIKVTSTAICGSDLHFPRQERRPHQSRHAPWASLRMTPLRG